MFSKSSWLHRKEEFHLQLCLQGLHLRHTQPTSDISLSGPLGMHRRMLFVHMRLQSLYLRSILSGTKPKQSCHHEQHRRDSFIPSCLSKLFGNPSRPTTLSSLLPLLRLDTILRRRLHFVRCLPQSDIAHPAQFCFPFSWLLQCRL